ncbi:hypothetical protein [Lampropedia puyangensis]|nr:hypothetical protein [Lampropedia puyangensis]
METSDLPTPARFVPTLTEVVDAQDATTDTTASDMLDLGTGDERNLQVLDSGELIQGPLEASEHTVIDSETDSLAADQVTQDPAIVAMPDAQETLSALDPVVSLDKTAEQVADEAENGLRPEHIPVLTDAMQPDVAFLPAHEAPVLEVSQTPQTKLVRGDLPLEFEEQLVHRVMQRVDAVLAERISQAIASVIEAQTRSLLPSMREELEFAVRTSVYEAMADELTQIAEQSNPRENGASGE